MKTLLDKRVSNYWDGKGELVEGYKTILPTKKDGTDEYVKAWDVFLLFPTRRWMGRQTLLADGWTINDQRWISILEWRLRDASLLNEETTQMTMNCCATESETADDKSREMVANEISAQRCRNCLGHSRAVSRKTVLLMLKPELQEQAMTGTYSFCSTADCPVVYFEEQNRHSFTLDDLRVTVGVKAIQDPIPLCYCFGFDESHIRDEVSRTGRTTVPERISRLIREGLCACESRNPAGVCCLGEVNRAAKRLTLTWAVFQISPWLLG